VKAAGIAAVIHKATEGKDFTDSEYAKRRKEAQEAGLLWGSYHFGTASDPVEQADHFLAVVKPADRDVIVLDYELNEPNPGNTMSMQKAEAFVTRVFEKTGRYPGLYAGAHLRDQLNGTPNPVLAKCWLWLAAWHEHPKPLAGWSKFILWQYTDGVTGPEPHTVPSIGVCDRSQFNGTMDELRAFFGAGG
jgi:lysozyme